MRHCFQVNVKVETLRLDKNDIDYVGANYLSEMLMNNFYITSLVRTPICVVCFYVAAFS